MSKELLLAVETGNIGKVEELLRSGSVDVNYQPNNAESAKYKLNKKPIAISVSKSDYAMTYLLLKHGANIETEWQTDSSITIFHSFMSQQLTNKTPNLKFAALLISYGAKINIIQHSWATNIIEHFRKSGLAIFVNFFLAASLLTNNSDFIAHIVQSTNVRLTGTKVEEYLALLPRKMLTKFEIDLILENVEYCAQKNYIEPNETPKIQKALSEYFEKVALKDSKPLQNTSTNRSLLFAPEKSPEMTKSKDDTIMELSRLIREQDEKLQAINAKLDAILRHANISLTQDSNTSTPMNH
jgi:hypothetical protein